MSTPSPARRAVRRVALVAGIGALVGAAARAVLGRRQAVGAGRGRGSFDTWPTVTPAPGRRHR